MKKISKYAIIIRATTMSLALAATIYAIYHTKNNPIGGELLGAAKTQPTSGKLDLCPTRIKEIRLHFAEKKTRYFQTDSIHWYHQKGDGQVEELHPLFLEKWLGQYCLSKIDRFLDRNNEVFQPKVQLEIDYIDGTKKQIQLGGGAIDTTNLLVESSFFYQGLKELEPDAHKTALDVTP